MVSRSVTAHYKTTDCFFTTSIDPMCRTTCFTSGCELKITWIISVCQESCHLENFHLVAPHFSNWLIEHRHRDVMHRFGFSLQAFWGLLVDLLLSDVLVSFPLACSYLLFWITGSRSISTKSTYLHVHFKITVFCFQDCNLLQKFVEVIWRKGRHLPPQTVPLQIPNRKWK